MNMSLIFVVRLGLFFALRQNWRVSLLAIVADHRSHGLAMVEKLTPLVDGLEKQLSKVDGVSGAVLLATCNRIEIYLELESPKAYPKARQLLSQRLGDLWDQLDLIENSQVTERLFRLACGLESQVVGEREITGQMRRALSRSRQLGTCSFILAQNFEAAIRSSKRVERETGLAGRGRSIVSVGLSMIERKISLAGKTAIIVGTGNYAGAVAARLKERNLAMVQVYSESGRADQFARLHRLTPIGYEDLSVAMAKADLVVACRGFGRPAIPADKVKAALAGRSPSQILALLDLAVTHDVEAQVAELPGTEVIDLEDIRDAVPPADQVQVERAEAIIAEEIDSFDAELSIRGIGGDIANLHAWAEAHVHAEIYRMGDNVDLESAQMALHRLSAALVHLPTILMRNAAAQGRTEGLLDDINELTSTYLDKFNHRKTGYHCHKFPQTTNNPDVEESGDSDRMSNI